MYTRNWYNAFRAIMLPQNKYTVGLSKQYNGTSFNHVSCGNMQSYAGYILNGQSRTLTTSMTHSYGVVFGTGDTPESIEDYKLAGEIITTLALDATNVTGSVEDGVFKRQIGMTVRNKGTEEVTIKEVGFPTYCASNASNYSLMTERFVLNEPLTLAAGESGVVNIIQEFPFPVDY